MGMRALGGLVLLLLIGSGCAGTNAQRCPFGTAAQPARAAAIDRLLATTDAASLRAKTALDVCFDTSGEHAQLLTRNGVRAVLSEVRDDRELAGELAHLLVHYLDQLGDGCAQGLAAALASEDRAEALEQRVRASLQLPPAVFTTVARDDYRRRCR